MDRTTGGCKDGWMDGWMGGGEGWEGDFVLDIVTE